jgi:hypothetical protein
MTKQCVNCKYGKEAGIRSSKGHDWICDKYRPELLEWERNQRKLKKSELMGGLIIPEGVAIPSELVYRTDTCGDWQELTQ